MFQRNLRFASVVSLVVVLAALVFGISPADAAESAFHLVEAKPHADQDAPEYCLTFSKPFASSDRAAVAGALHLEADGQKQNVQPRDLSLTADTLCLQQLSFRRDYKLRIKNLRSAANDALDKPVALAFRLPDRKAEMAFVPLLEKEGRFPKMTKESKSGLSLRTLNVTATRTILYKLSDKAALAGVWDRYAQLGLTAFESLAYAKEHGQQVGQGDIVFSDKSNVPQSIDVMPPFGPNGAAAGVYFLYAEPKDAARLQTLSAGGWFIVSDLGLSAVATPQGYRAFLSSVASRKPVANARIAAYVNGRLVQEAKTDADGQAVLSAAEAPLLVAEDESGQIAIVNLARQADAAFKPIEGQGVIVPDRDSYKSGQTAQISLLARDASGKPEKAGASFLKLLRPDRALAAEISVPADQEGPLVVSFPMPVSPVPGVWTLLWQRTDGRVLGMKDLELAARGPLGAVDLRADRTSIDRDGKIGLSVAVKDQAGKPVAWRKGLVTVRYERPRFAAWEAYLFGASPDQAQDVLAKAPFLTQEDGRAEIEIETPLSARDANGRALRIEASVADGAVAAPLVLPVRATEAGSAEAWVGVRKATLGKPFAENAVAVFDIIALDSAGKRKAQGEYYYQIYEEGRSFTWLQSDGQWDYKRQAEHRRIGGGRFATGPSGEAKIETIVTAGHYVLEIASAGGAVLAQVPFDADARASGQSDEGEAKLMLVKNPPEFLQANQEASLSLHLEAPASVSLLVGDGSVRFASQRVLAAGDHKLLFVPQAQWGQALNLRVEALFDSGRRAVWAGGASLRRQGGDVALSLAAPSSLASGATASVSIDYPQIAAQHPARVSVLAAFDEGAERDTHSETLILDRAGRASLSLPVPSDAKTMRLTLLAAGESDYAVKTLRLPVVPALQIEGPDQKILGVGDQAAFALSFMPTTAPSGAYQADITVGDGVRLTVPARAKLTLEKGRLATLPLGIVADKEGRSFVQMTLTGPKGYKAVHSVALPVVGEALALAAEAESKLDPQQATVWKKGKGDALLVSPHSLGDAPTRLGAFLKFNPVTTIELADWLQAARLWRDAIVALGIETPQGLSFLETKRRAALWDRQIPDGGFAALAGSEGDLRATAAALREVANDVSPRAVLAVRWLQRKLENTWFDESERTDRALALAALAALPQKVKDASGARDPSALRYFAETSRDKDLPPVASAALSYAFASLNENDAARTWFALAREGLRKKRGEESLPLLAANGLTQNGDLDGNLLSSLPMLASLRVAGLLSVRNGTWHMVENGVDRKHYGIAAFAGGDEVRLENKAASSLSLASLTKNAKGPAAPAKGEASFVVQRQLYGLDGERLANDAPLVVGRDYLLVLHGVAKTDAAPDEPIVVSLPTYAALTPVVLIEPELMDDQWGWQWDWVPQPRTSVRSTRLTDTSLGFILPPVKEWRVVFLVRASTAGNFALPQMEMRLPEGNPLPLQQNQLRLRVSGKEGR